MERHNMTDADLVEMEQTYRNSDVWGDVGPLIAEVRRLREVSDRVAWELNAPNAWEIRVANARRELSAPRAA